MANKPKPPTSTLREPKSTIRNKFEFGSTEGEFKRKALEILPVNEETIRNPESFANWLYSHSPIILEALFKEVEHLHPRDAARILLEIFKTCVNHRPYSSKHYQLGGDNSKDVVSYLEKFLNDNNDK